MTNNFINVAFDSASLGAITNLARFGAFLEPEMGAAMSQIGDIIVQAAVANTWAVFEAPTGALADSIRAILDGPMAVEVGSDSPYAARREFGFSGQTDSRGRFYANDPAKPYLTPALEQNSDQILQVMGLATAEAFAKMGVPL